MSIIQYCGTYFVVQRLYIWSEFQTEVKIYTTTSKNRKFEIYGKNDSFYVILFGVDHYILNYYYIVTNKSLFHIASLVFIDKLWQKFRQAIC